MALVVATLGVSRARALPMIRASVQDVLHIVPLSVKDVGEGLLLVQEPLKPIDVEAPGASEAL